MIRDQHWLLEEKHRGDETPAYQADLGRLAQGEPVAYVIGSQPFLGLSIQLDSKPLIPRVETEWWTNELLKGIPADASLSFLDLCAGSGAIGCAALKRFSNAEVAFGELDPAHEATIRKNIGENGLDESRADVRIGDLFEPFGDAKFDVIAANPPYVPTDRDLPLSVARYEPASALFAGPDGLDVIRRIAAELPRHLAKDGVAWIECDRSHAKAAAHLFEERGFRTEIRTDQYGKPRILLISFR